MSGGISICTNFDVNQNIPIDSRLVASNSTVRNNIVYKYDGLKVYQLDNQQSYIWDGSSWRVEYNGVYGGSGSLPNDTYIDLNQIGNTIGSQSYIFGYLTNTDTNSVFLDNKFVRHQNVVTTGTSEWNGVEFRNQYVYNDSVSLKDGPYISYNPIGTVERGGIAFGTGDTTTTPVQERVRISGKGYVGIKTTQPKSYLQLGTKSPLTLDLNGTNDPVIGSNWYYDKVSLQDDYFTFADGSTKMIHNNGSILFQNRQGGGLAGYQNSLYLSPNSSVGIKTTSPSYDLDVNGNIRSTNVIYSDLLVNSPKYELKDLSNTEIYTDGSGLVFKSLNSDNLKIKQGTSSFVNDVDVTNGDLIVYDGSITNFEDDTKLTPNSTVYFSKVNDDWSDTTSISSFTHSITSYRVGALVHTNIRIEVTSDIILAKTIDEFYGILLKLESSEFNPVKTSFGHGHGGRDGISQGPFFSPLSIEVFKNDPDNSTIPTATGNQFWIRIKTFKNNSDKFGGNLVDQDTVDDVYVIRSGVTFNGTITYKS